MFCIKLGESGFVQKPGKDKKNMAPALEMLKTDGKKEHYMMKNLPNILLPLIKVFQKIALVSI